MKKERSIYTFGSVQKLIKSRKKHIEITRFIEVNGVKDHVKNDEKMTVFERFHVYRWNI